MPEGHPLTATKPQLKEITDLHELPLAIIRGDNRASLRGRFE